MTTDSLFLTRLESLFALRREENELDANCCLINSMTVDSSNATGRVHWAALLGESFKLNGIHLNTFVFVISSLIVLFLKLFLKISLS